MTTHDPDADLFSAGDTDDPDEEDACLDDDSDGDEAFCDDDEPDEESAVARARRVAARTRQQAREAEKLVRVTQARDEGRDAYRCQMPRDTPPYTDEKLVSEWQWGWDVAHVAATQGRDARLVSCLPANEPDPAVACAAYKYWMAEWNHRPMRVRDEYPELPWSMADLIGSMWINLHTGCELRIGAIAANGAGQPVPVSVADQRSYRPDDRYSHRRSIGFWWSHAFLIEHWIRVDGFTPAERLRWYGVEMQSLRHRLLQQEASLNEMRKAGPDRVSCYGTNTNMALKSIALAKQEIAALTQRMTIFAEQHSLVVPSALLNAGLVDPTTGASLTAAPAQLSLF